MEKDPVIAAQEVRIAKVLANLPSTNLLVLIETCDQLRYWMTNRSFRASVSQCWTALLKGENDPLYPLLKSGELPRDIYNYVLLTTDFYFKVWALAQISFPYVRPVLTRLGAGEFPRSAYELFAGILVESADKCFLRCFEPYSEVSASKIAEKRKLFKKVASGEATVKQKEQAAKLQKQASHPDTLLPLTLAICEVKAPKHKGVFRARLEDVYKAMERLADCEVTLRRNGGSYAWKDGKMLRGQVGGGYTQDA
jgi:hypothetical protein